MNLGTIVKNYIDEHHLSAREFSRSANLSNTYISQIINGEKKNPSIDAFKSIASTMGYSVQELFDMVDDNQQFYINVKDYNENTCVSETGAKYISYYLDTKNNEEQKIIELYRNASEPTKNAIKALLEFDKK